MAAKSKRVVSADDLRAAMKREELARASKCRDEIQAALDRHNCEILSSLHIEDVASALQGSPGMRFGITVHARARG